MQKRVGQLPAHHPDTLSQVATFIEQYALLPESGTVVVAVSGGADSLCLLHVLHMLCGPSTSSDIPMLPLKRYPHVALHVAHLDHQLRGEQSTREAESVGQLAHSWGLPVTIGSVDVPALAQQEHRSLEDAARTARYRFLREVARGQPIAVAHQQDDQVETLLLHWIRGGGIHSMIGLQPRTQDIIRPLLSVRHAEALDYCKQYGLTPIEDESNTDTRFLRNRIRHELLPLLEQMNSGFRNTLLRTAEVMSVDADWIDIQVEQHWPTIATVEDEAIRLSVEGLNALPLSLQRHTLRRAASLLSGGQSPLELRHYQLIEQLMQRSHLTRNVLLHLPNSLIVRRDGDTLSIERWLPSQKIEYTKRERQVETVLLPIPGEVLVPHTPWMACAELLSDEIMDAVRHALQEERWEDVFRVLQPTAYSVYIDAESIGKFGLYIRPRQPGDRMQPLGMAHEKKLQDIFIDRHIPREEREMLPLFLADEHPVWLGGIILDERARLHKNTQRIVRLQLQLQR